MSNSTDLSLEEYLLTNLKDDEGLKMAPDGNLHILLNNVVIDENGKVACFNYSGIRYRGKDGTSRVLDDRNLVPKIEKLMADTPPIRPATLNGNKVPSRLKTSVSDYKLEVRDHIITYNLETPQKVPLK